MIWMVAQRMATATQGLLSNPPVRNSCCSLIAQNSSAHNLRGIRCPNFWRTEYLPPQFVVLSGTIRATHNKATFNSTGCPGLSLLMGFVPARDDGNIWLLMRL